MAVDVFDARSCFLGEGPLWHPEVGQLFWFDILGCRLLSQKGGVPLQWNFNRQVSAAAWIDNSRLLIASETGLTSFDLTTEMETEICDIERENADTRSNDGRADPWGGFWIGTMAKSGEPGHGSLYRWYRGTLRQLQSGLGTPNAICFDRRRLRVYWADTKQRCIYRQALSAEDGWPVGPHEAFVDLSATPTNREYKPDGAVIDAEGCLWNAQWGAARVACYSPDGRFLEALHLPTGHTSCPAFGGPMLNRLFVTTARQGLPEHREDWARQAGCVFVADVKTPGVPEPAVVIAP